MTGRDTPELPSFYKHFNLSALIQLPVMTSFSLQFLKPKLFSLLSWYLQLDLIFLIQAVQFVLDFTLLQADEVVYPLRQSCSSGQQSNYLAPFIDL